MAMVRSCKNTRQIFHSCERLLWAEQRTPMALTLAIRYGSKASGFGSPEFTALLG